MAVTHRMTWFAIVLAAACSPRHAGRAPYVDGRLETISRDRIRLALTVRDGWHIGGNRPGGGGLPTRIAWGLPNGWAIADERWPAPRQVPAAGDTLLAYSGDVDIEVVLDRSASADPGPINAVVTYGACRDMCVAGRLSLSLER